MTEGTGRATGVGAQRRCPLFLSLSWRQEDSANVLGAGNYVLILGSLHDHQLHSAWTAALRNLFSKTNRHVLYIGSLAARMGSHCSWACQLEPRRSTVPRKRSGQSLRQTQELQTAGRRARDRGAGACCVAGSLKLRSDLPKVTQPTRTATPGPRCLSPPRPGPQLVCVGWTLLLGVCQRSKLNEVEADLP